MDTMSTDNLTTEKETDQMDTKREKGGKFIYSQCKHL